MINNMINKKVQRKIIYTVGLNLGSDGLAKRGAGCKKNRGHFLVFQNKMISKKRSSI